MILALVFLFTTVLAPTVDKLEGKLHNRILSVLIVLVSILIILGLFSYIFVAQFSTHITNLTSKLDKKEIINTFNNNFEQTINKLPAFIRNFAEDQSKEMNFSAKATEYFQSFLGQFIDLIQKIGSFVFYFFMTFIFTIITLYEYHNFKRFFIRFISNRYYETSLKILSKIEEQVSINIRCQFRATLRIAFMTAVGLGILNIFFQANITLIIFLGIISGIASLIPFFGIFIGIVPAILVSILFNLGSEYAISNFFFIPHIIVIFILVFQLDKSIISPMILHKKVGLHPLMVLVVLIIGGNLMGPIGMLFVVPIAGVIKIFFVEIMWMVKHSYLL
jgi:predicted PurR-regulated permease PerM